MKFAIAVFVVLLFGSGVTAQVSCSPNVSKETCTSVAQDLNIVVDHGVLRGVAIPVELVTPAEYKKRLADTKEQESRELDYAGGIDKAATHPDQFSPFYRHTLANVWSDNITFFRNKPSTNFVSAILISTEAFDGVETYPITEGPGKGGSGVRGNGQFDSSKVYPVGSFIAGYVAGTVGTMFDRSITGDYFIKAEKH
jgi:hypothetical protein